MWKFAQLALVATVSANFGTLDDIIHELNANISKLNINSQNLLRNGMGNAQQELELLTCYGCWCYRGVNHGEGLGQAQNEYDKVCRSHHQAYECIQLDAEAQGLASCNPTEKASIGFTYEFRIETNEEGKGDMVLQCSEDQDWCTRRTCEVDLKYISDFWALLMAGEPMQRDIYGHENKHIHPITGEHHGTFDPAACPIGGKIYQPVKKCCGKYPARKVYKTSADGDDGHRQCCDLEGNESNDGSTRGKPFLKDSQTCCGSSGGVMEGFGETCDGGRKRRSVEKPSWGLKKNSDKMSKNGNKLLKKRSTISHKKRR